MVGGTSIGKTICSICYEDLKPLVEDLQAISICGHWFEYCSSAKKCSCPVCKQSCSASNVNRLYFQSVGDSNDPILSQNVEDEDPRELRGQVQRLEVKVKGLSSLLERQGKELKDVNGQVNSIAFWILKILVSFPVLKKLGLLCSCKELAKQEAALKNEALKQRTSMQQMLHMKSEELEKSTLERLRLQEKNMSYKELMAKCNLLGRGEARFGKKLEKAKEKINILKTRLQELETALEVKDNEVLRSLKASKKSSSKRVIQNAVNCNSSSNPLPANNFPSEDQEKHLSGSKLTSDQTGSLTSNPLCSRKLEKFSFTNHMKSNKKGTSAMVLDKGRDDYFLIDEDPSKFSTVPCVLSNPDSRCQIGEDVTEQTTTPLRSEEASDLNKETKVHRLDNLVGHLGSKTGINNDMGKTHATLDKDVILVPDDVTEVEPMLNIRKESPSPLPLSEPGDVCFSGGFLGPDGTNRYLGKWCKRGLSKESNTGNLIAVGADGRGGRIKVLRSLSQSSLDGKETSVGAKRFKSGAKTNNSQSSQGCLQIEHFFGRVVNN
ncbi:hypothetical protein CFP56_021614 [Quercus suber]|uniref:RING-type domain-containing protein n=1 Tax=Quercus suber TaxID=58331 RepID=A0AAW0LZP5_QUESU